MSARINSLGCIGYPQPPCARCQHRRIFHYRKLSGSIERGNYKDVAVRCSIEDCLCEEYQP